jgi:DNA repair photolyase
VLKDLETLCQINQVYAAISFTITTADDALGKKLEPGAPPVSERLRAMKVLSEHGIRTGVTMMPILPFIEDNEENITQIITRAHASGATYIIPSFGMSLRDRQRAYYYGKLEQWFPGLKKEYQRRFGNQYHCPANNVARLEARFRELCAQYGMATRIAPYAPETARQLSLF